MPIFGIIPPEPPRIASLDNCAPLFANAVKDVLLDMGNQAIVYESTRTEERQKWLYGFGRDYDDGRGIVTNAITAKYGWHFFGLAVDIIHRIHEWNADEHWWDGLEIAYNHHGLTAGRSWRMKDNPHGQWGKCRTTPSDLARELFQKGGNHAVWTAVGAV